MNGLIPVKLKVFDLYLCFNFFSVKCLLLIQARCLSEAVPEFLRKMSRARESFLSQSQTFSTVR